MYVQQKRRAGWQQALKHGSGMSAHHRAAPRPGRMPSLKSHLPQSAPAGHASLRMHHMPPHALVLNQC